MFCLDGLFSTALRISDNLNPKCYKNEILTLHGGHGVAGAYPLFGEGRGTPLKG